MSPPGRERRQRSSCQQHGLEIRDAAGAELSHHRSPVTGHWSYSRDHLAGDKAKVDAWLKEQLDMLESSLDQAICWTDYVVLLHNDNQ